MIIDLAFIRPPQGMEWIIILVVALLVFGKRLPEMGRSLGRGLVEFKKGLKGIKDEVDDVEREVEDAERKAKLEDQAATARKLEAPSINEHESIHEKAATVVGERNTQGS